MKQFLAILLLMPYQIYASISDDLDNFFQAQGYSSNTTNPTAFNTQAAGGFGGGSLYARNQVRQFQLVQLDLPNYRAGCGGIDLYTGSISFLSNQKLADLGKLVMTNAPAYAADVFLATTVPELKQVRDYLQGLEQAANHASITSCEAAQNLVGGVWPKTLASQQKICKDQGTIGKEGLFSDYVQARMECSSNGFNKAIENASKNPETKKQVVFNKNLVWEILKTNSFLSSNSELAEMVMSLTGTIIIDKQGKITNVPSLATSPSLINTLIGKNTSTELWKCNNTKDCMDVKLSNFEISEQKTLIYRVREIIQSLNQKIKTDTKPNAEEINFLSLTSIPVLKFLLVLNMSQQGNANVDLEDYALLITQDLLQQYLQELLDEVSKTSGGQGFNEDLMNIIEIRINSAKQAIATISPEINRKFKAKLALVDQMMRFEKQVSANLEG